MYPIGMNIQEKGESIEMEQSETVQCCCSTERRTVRGEEQVKLLINRLNRIEGQIRGLKGMIEKDAYCADILTQSAAVAAALNGFNKELLVSHMKGCVVRDIREGRAETVDELVALLGKLMR